MYLILNEFKNKICSYLNKVIVIIEDYQLHKCLKIKNKKINKLELTVRLHENPIKTKIKALVAGGVCEKKKLNIFYC